MVIANSPPRPGRNGSPGCFVRQRERGTVHGRVNQFVTAPNRAHSSQQSPSAFVIGSNQAICERPCGRCRCDRWVPDNAPLSAENTRPVWCPSVQTHHPADPSRGRLAVKPGRCISTVAIEMIGAGVCEEIKRNGRKSNRGGKKGSK